jgi:drug/metabolite transporter (DMT)-like permease
MRYATADRGSSLAGIGLAAAAFFCFPLHDAIVKWLLHDYGIQQILLIRSAVAIIVALCMGGGSKVVSRSIRSSALHLLVGRAFIVMAAWGSFYAAARTLKLSELITIYFSSPLLVAILALVVLGERITPQRWFGLGLGFAGVLVAVQPDGGGKALAVGLATTAAILWAYSMLLIRMLGTSESTAVQMLISNAVIFICCLAAVPLLSWRWPSCIEASLLLAVGIIGAAAQYLLFESARRAIAAIIATMEFTSLAWAFLFGFLIWGDIPRPSELFGATLIVLSGILMIAAEWHSYSKERRLISTAHRLADIHDV